MEFLMYAKQYEKQSLLTSYYISEKFEGIRCFWDGGISRGFMCRDIIYANPNANAYQATGLWTRYANPIFVPIDWLSYLPKNICLDGELWISRTSFDTIASICRKHQPSKEWNKVKYLIFDSPQPDIVFMTRWIHNPHCKMGIFGGSEWAKRTSYVGGDSYAAVYEALQKANLWNDHVSLIQQYTVYSQREIDEFVKKVIDNGGEGVMLRNPLYLWYPDRTDHLLKYKPPRYAEGTIIGFQQSQSPRIYGLIGSLMVVTDNHVIFNLGVGLTDKQRKLVDPSLLKPGVRIQFAYRKLSSLGKPIEARFLHIV